MPVRYSSNELIRIITSDGWYCVSVKGSHNKFKHKTKSGIVVIPHPKSIIPPGTASQILKAAGCKPN